MKNASAVNYIKYPFSNFKLSLKNSFFSRISNWLFNVVKLGILILFILPCPTTAGETADLIAYVKIQKLSVSINPMSYDFGVMTAGGIKVADSYIAVINSGNITEKFKLSIPSEPNGTWTSVTANAPGEEEYRISAIFKDTAPDSGDYGAEDSFSVSTERIASSTDLAIDTDPAGEKGYNVIENGWRKLWFKFEAPTSTEITTQQAITVRVTALPD